jgi:hypothetical protein
VVDRRARSQAERTRPEGPPSSSTSYGTTSSPERKRACPPRLDGLWLAARGSPPRRLAGPSGVLGFIHEDRIGFTDTHTGASDTHWLRWRIASTHRRTITAAYDAPDDCDTEFDAGGPLYDHGHIYWNEDCGTSAPARYEDLFRARPFHPTCASHITNWAAAAHPDVTIDHGNIFYASDRRIFEVTPDRLLWPPPHCRRY